MGKGEVVNLLTNHHQRIKEKRCMVMTSMVIGH